MKYSECGHRVSKKHVDTRDRHADESLRAEAATMQEYGTVANDAGGGDHVGEREGTFVAAPPAGSGGCPCRTANRPITPTG